MTLVVSIGATIIEGATLGAVTSAAVTGSTLGSVGAGILGGTVTGAGLGAVKSAIAGEDVGKGALMGAATGAVGGGLAPGVGAAGAAAGEAGSAANIAAQAVAGAGTGALANTAGAAVGGKPIGTAALIGGLTGGALAGVNAAGETPITGPVDTPPNGVSASLETSSPLSGLSNISGTQALQNVGILGTGAMAENAMNKKPEAPANVTPARAPGLPAAMSVNSVYGQGPLGGLGSIGMARGGQVPLKNGAYIIPADVVSALGNGSSKAGAEFLRRLMDEVKREAVGRHGLGAVKRDAA